MADELRVGRDLLDAQLVDQDERRMGKVDGVVLVVRAGAPPRVSALETGLVALAGRFRPRWRERVARWRRRLGLTEGPVRIGMEKVERFGLDVKVAIDARRTSAFALERWLRDHVVARIPGGREKGKK